MARCIALLAMLFLLPVMAYAARARGPDTGKTFNSNTGVTDLCLKVTNESGTVVNDQCHPIKISDGAITESGDFFLIQAGGSMASGTSLTTSQTAPATTSYSIVRKAISSDPAFQTGVLADGRVGQIITYLITECPVGASFVLTPTHATGFTSVVFEGVGDQATFLFVSTAVGWIRLNTDAVQSNL